MNRIINNFWGVSRIFRMLFGGYIFVVSLWEGQYFLSLIGAFFIYQAISNTGCGACAIPPEQSKVELELNKENKIDVDYEEI